MPGAGRRFGHAHRFPIKSIAGRKSAGVCGGGAGSGPSGRMMPTSGTIRRVRNVRGRGRTVPTGGLIGRDTLSTHKPSASVQSSDGGIVGGAQRGETRSQRWTRQSRFRQFRQGLTFWCRGMRKSSQRWTR